DDVAAQVADRPHEPAAEPVHRAAPPLLGQPAGDDVAVGEAAPPQVPDQALPLAGRVAHAEAGGVVGLEAPLGQELAADRAVRGVELLHVELGGDPVRLDQPRAQPPVLAGAARAAAVLVAELDARLGREPLHRLGEGQVLDLLDEPDDVAARLAAEAEVQPARGRPVERRRLLVMERAEALEVAPARVAELEVLADHVGDGRALPHERDVLVANPACHEHGVYDRARTSGAPHRNRCAPDLPPHPRRAVRTPGRVSVRPESGFRWPDPAGGSAVKNEITLDNPGGRTM